MTTGPISDSPVPRLALFVSLYTPSPSLSLSNLRLPQTFLPYTSCLFHSPTFRPQLLKLFKPCAAVVLYLQPNCHHPGWLQFSLLDPTLLRLTIRSQNS